MDKHWDKEYRDGGSISSDRRFTEWDFNKLMASDKFRAVWSGNLWEIIEEGRTRVLGKFNPKTKSLYISGDKNMDNFLVVWMTENGFVNSDEYAILANGGGVGGERTWDEASRELEKLKFQDYVLSNKEDEGRDWQNPNAKEDAQRELKRSLRLEEIISIRDKIDILKKEYFEGKEGKSELLKAIKFLNDIGIKSEWEGSKGKFPYIKKGYDSSNWWLKDAKTEFIYIGNQDAEQLIKFATNLQNIERYKGLSVKQIKEKREFERKQKEIAEARAKAREDSDEGKWIVRYISTDDDDVASVWVYAESREEAIENAEDDNSDIGEIISVERMYANGGGIGNDWFWNHAYRHYMRDASLEQRNKVKAQFIKEDLELDGESPRHSAIISSIVGEYANGGGVGDEFYVGQSVIMNDTNSSYKRMTKDIRKIVSPYINKELVIEEIINNKPYNLAKAFVRSSGQKVPFEIKLNEKYIEQYANGGGVGDLIISEIVDDEIRIYEKNINNLLSFVGEGIDSFDVYSESLSGKSNIKTDEIQNEVNITFVQNAWGGISLEEWEQVKNKLDKYIGKGGFEDYTINSSSNSLTLEFVREYPIGEYANGGGIERIDLFEDYENIPTNIQEILDEYSQDFEDGNYDGLAKALEEVESQGYTFEYYLDGQAYGLRPIGVPLNELKGYEDMGEEYANGGGVEDGSYERSLVLKALNGDEDFITKFISEGRNESEYISNLNLNKDFVYIQRKEVDEMTVDFIIKVEFDGDEDGIRGWSNEIIEVEGVEIDIKSFTKDEQKKINDFISELKEHLHDRDDLDETEKSLRYAGGGAVGRNLTDKIIKKLKDKGYSFGDNVELTETFNGKEINLNFYFKFVQEIDEIQHPILQIKIISKYLDFDRVDGLYETDDVLDWKLYKGKNLVCSIVGYWDDAQSGIEYQPTVIKIGDIESSVFDFYPFSGQRLEREVVDQLGKNLKNALNEIKQKNLYSAVVSLEGYEQYHEEVDGLENAKQAIQDIKENTRFQVVKGDVAVGDLIKQDEVIENYAEGGGVEGGVFGIKSSGYHRHNYSLVSGACFKYNENYEKAFEIWNLEKPKIKEFIEKNGGWNIDFGSMGIKERPKNNWRQDPFINLVVSFNIDGENEIGKNNIIDYYSGIGKNKIGDMYWDYVNSKYYYYEKIMRDGGGLDYDTRWAEMEAYSPYTSRAEYENKKEYEDLAFASKTFSKTAEMLVRENLNNGEICMCKLTKILGHEPNYPIQIVGSLKLEKCFMKRFYKLA